ncbi:MAG: hypothetical protein ABR518_04620 [Actinomycetota bacterium]
MERLEPVPPAQLDGRLQRRVERLEFGMRLLADTVRRAFGDLDSSLQQVRSDISRTARALEADRAAARVTARADAARATTQEGQPSLPGLDRADLPTDAPSGVLRAAIDRLMESIGEAQAIVDTALQNGRDGAGSTPNAGGRSETKGRNTAGPDPKTIWGEEDEPEFGELDLEQPSDRRRRSRFQRRLQHSWAGRVYANYKYRRT